MDSTTVEKAYLSVKDNSSDEESVPPMNAIQKQTSDGSSEESDSEGLSAYEKLRLKNIEEQQEFMRTLGIQEAVLGLRALMPEQTVAPPKKRVKIKREPLPKREPSERIIYLAAKPYMKMVVKKKVKVDKEGRLLGLMPMTFETQESRDLFISLSSKIKLETNIDSDVNSCDIKGLQKRLSSFRFTNDKRLFNIMIESLEFHPTTESKLVIAGSSYGEIGFWDLELKRFATFKPHCARVSCLSVSISELTKVFSSSCDGSFLCGDLELRKFSKVYATDLKERLRRLTWHDQLDANSFLLSHDSGRVGMLDLRDQNAVTSWYPCFESSARTVHHHPIHGNYFVVSSGSWYSSNVYDLRNCSSSKAEPVSEFPHNKGLTSAFFSPSGDKVLTTCKDDFLRIYTSPLNNRPSLKKILLHKNHSRGRGSELKAKWYPGRNDAFVIGSLLTPSRIQIYGMNGKIINELKDPEGKLSRTPNICVHPSLPLVAGGSCSGKVYIFSTEVKEPQT